MAFNILVVGAGSIASRHIQNCIDLYGIEQLTVVRKDIHAAIESFNCKNIDVYSSIDDALVDSHYDFAIICSPSSLHLSHAKALFQAKIPCLIEKPLAHTGSDAQELYLERKKQQVYSKLAYNLRFTKGYKVLKNILCQNSLGKIWRIESEVGQYLPDWRPNKPYQNSVSAQSSLGGGALLELSHELDYLLGLFPFKELSLQSMLSTHEFLTMDCENEALILANAELTSQEESLTFLLKLDMLQRIPSRKLLIIFERGKIQWDLIKRTIVIEKAFNQEVDREEITVEESANQAYISLMTEFITQLEAEDDAARELLSDASLDQGITVSKIIESIHLSNNTKRINVTP